MQTKDHKKKPVTVKIATWSARHRWWVFGLWFVLCFGLVFGSSAIPASKEKYDPYAGLDWESAKAWTALTANGGAPEQSEDFFLIATNPSLKTTDPAFKAAVDKMTETLKGYTYTENGQTKPLFIQLVNPYQAPPQVGLISKDETAVRIYGKVHDEGDWTKMQDRLEPFEAKIKDLKAQNPDFNLLVKNQTLNWIAANNDSNQELMNSLLITLIPTFIILLLVFRALVASIVPLVLAITALVGTTGIVMIYSRVSGNNNITLAMMLAVLMGLAVAVDYSLFIISRYRQERQHGRDKLEAIEVASGTAGRAVFFSGLLVAISISGLFILGSIFIPMAIGVIAVVLMSVLGSFTFLPALLSILGKGINWGRLPFTGKPRPEATGFWAAIVRGVMRRPVVVTVVAVAFLVTLATPLLHIKLGESENLDPKTEGQKAVALMKDKWPQGTDLKVLVTVVQADQPQTQQAIERFQQAALQLPGLSGPVELTPSLDGKAVMLGFLQSGSWNDDANRDVVRKLRTETVPAYFGQLPGVQVYVGGQTAMQLDQIVYFNNPLVWLFVLGLSFVVLLLVFRSVVIPFKAIILNLFSTGAAYGIVILVFQDGHAWVKATGVMESFLPVFIFAIIFGLSMDYHMFILTRIKELRDKGYSSNEAVLKGISSTSGTITGAAAIMVVVFGDFFVSLSDPSIQQFGLGLAVAVLLDATIVRCMLLPAVMKLLGQANWWMPKFLNFLPTITIESEPVELAAPVIEAGEEELVAA